MNDTACPAIELRALDSNLWDQYRHFYFGALPVPARPPEHGIWLVCPCEGVDVLLSGLMLFPSSGPFLVATGFAAREELSEREKHDCARITLRLLFEYAALTGKRVIIPRLSRSMALGMLRRGYKCSGAEWTPPALKIKTPQPGKVKPAAGPSTGDATSSGTVVTNASVSKKKPAKRTARKAPRKRSKRVA